MKVLVEGHKYELGNFEDKDEKGQIIQFIHKESMPDKYAPSGDGISVIVETGIMSTISDGTTNEEILTMLIDRMNYLQKKFPCRENAIVITKLEESLMWLEKRTTDRTKRNVEGKHLK